MFHILFLFSLSLSPIFFLFFRMDGHLYIMLQQKKVKNALKYWAKTVQMFIFKTRCDFLFIIFLFFERLINLNLFPSLTIFSLPSFLFCFLVWKYTSTFCCIKGKRKMCWIIDPKWCKSWYSKQGVIFLFFIYFWKNCLINFNLFWYLFFTFSLSHFLFCFF